MTQSGHGRGLSQCRFERLRCLVLSLGGGNETARFHYTSRWNGDLAACCARAATREGPPYRSTLACRDAEQEGTNYKAIVKGFADIGYIDGKTVVLEHRFPNEQAAQFRSMATELVASGVDVLVVIGANAPPYAKEATKTIPIVFALMPDPIGSKLVNNLARPEANVTGLSNSASDIVGKRLALFKEVIPGLSRVALLVNSNSSLAAGYEQGFQVATPTLGFQEMCSHGARRTNYLQSSPQ